MTYLTLGADHAARAATLRRDNELLRRYMVTGNVIPGPRLSMEAQELRNACLRAVAAQRLLNHDPLDEHANGHVRVDDFTVRWTIHYLDSSLRRPATHPTNPLLSRRLLVIELAD